MPLVEEFVKAFGVWDVAQPYIERIVEEPEMRLIVAMRGQALTVEEAAERLGMAPAEAAAFLERCYQRGVVHKQEGEDGIRYAPADFYTRLDYFIRFGEWKQLPAEARRALDERYVREYAARVRPTVEARMRGEETEAHLHNDAVMLLPEVEEMVEAAQEIIVLPCDCRLAGEHCDRPIEVCIWMDDLARGMLARGHGRRITSEEARQLLRWADKKGLMHTADPNWREHGLTAICNCCACDCYPFRAAGMLGSKGTWPRSRYIAAYDRDRCNLCGACVRRCHFGAFSFDGTTVMVEGKERRNVVYEPALCWGCGLCANTCPTQAIRMEPLSSGRDSSA